MIHRWRLVALRSSSLFIRNCVGRVEEKKKFVRTLRDKHFPLAPAALFYLFSESPIDVGLFSPESVDVIVLGFSSRIKHQTAEMQLRKMKKKTLPAVKVTTGHSFLFWLIYITLVCLRC